MARPKKSNEEKIYDYVKKHPGVRAEEISRALGLVPGNAGYLFRKLRDGGHLRGRGATRAMVYTATKKALA